MTIEVIGAVCAVKHHSDGGTEQIYVSFGNYDEDTEADCYGVPDSEIYGYADDVDDISTGYAHEFVVLDVELVVKDVQ